MRVALLSAGTVTQVSGGYLYNARLAAGLAARGITVDLRETPATVTPASLADCDFVIQDALAFETWKKLNATIAGKAVALVHLLRYHSTGDEQDLAKEADYLRTCAAGIFVSAQSHADAEQLLGMQVKGIVAPPGWDHMEWHATPELGAGHDATPRDSTPRDSTPRDTTPRDTTPRDSTPRDSTPRDSTPRDSTPRDATPRDATPRDATPRDATPRGSTPHDSTIRGSLPHRVSAPPPPLRILCVGNLEPRKGYFELFTALSLVRATWTLRIAGSGPTAELLSHARALGIDSRIDLAGSLTGDVLQRAFAAAHLFIVSSRYETYGIATVEAMAHALPILSWSGGGSPALVSGYGESVTPRDPALLARAIDTIAAAYPAAARAALEAAARKRATLTTWSDTARLVHEGLQKLRGV